MSRRWSSGILLFVVFAASAAFRASAATPELTLEGTRIGPSAGGGATILSSETSVLVYLTPGSENAAAASQARTDLRAFVASNRARIRYEYELLDDVVNVRGLRRDKVDALRNLPGVVSVVEDYPVHSWLNGSVPLIHGLQGQITGAGLAVNGSGIRVCVVDTGVNQSHIIFQNRIDTAAGYDFVNDDANPQDDHNLSHGSNVAGIAVGGDGFNVNFGSCGVQPFQGVAPESTLIAVKVLAANGFGIASDIIAGIEHCADEDLPNGPADVINLSLGGGAFVSDCDTDPIAQAANNAVAAGVVVVVASGNDGNTNAMSTPACASQVIAVGATYDADYPSCDVPNGTLSFANCTDVEPSVNDITCFSNRSVNLDVTAPGCVSFSASSPSANGLIGLCGTSQAAPHVAGLAALLLDVDPSLTPAEVGQAIRDAAIDLGPPGFDNGYGHGRIDVLATLQNRCGNGFVEFGEDCDDGNQVSGDGCDDCQVFDCPHTEICSGGCEPNGECNSIDTGETLCDTPNSVIACPIGKTIRLHVCECEAPPPTPPIGGQQPQQHQHFNQNGQNPQCGQNVTWSCQ